MARSRATPSAPPPVARRRLLVAGSEGLHLAPEVVDAGLQRGRRAVAVVEHQAADDRDDDGDHEEEDGAHGQIAPASTMCCASRPQLSPPSQVSRFQIGTVALSESMAKRAASNASPRWGAEATATTALSPTASTPTRWSRTMRPTVGHRTRASSATWAMRGTTWLSYASYSRRLTPGRPSAWSRAVPENRTRPPQSGRTAHSRAAPTGSGAAER